MEQTRIIKIFCKTKRRSGRYKRTIRKGKNWKRNFSKAKYSLGIYLSSSIGYNNSNDDICYKNKTKSIEQWDRNHKTKPIEQWDKKQKWNKNRK